MKISDKSSFSDQHFEFDILSHPLTAGHRANVNQQIIRDVKANAKHSRALCNPSAGACFY